MPGKIGTAINFAGAYECPISNPTNLQNGLTNFTFSVWELGWTTANGGSRMLLTIGGYNYPTPSTDNRIQLEIDTNNGGTLGSYVSGGVGSNFSNSLSWSGAQWYNIVYTYQSGVGGSLNFYRDGVAQGSFTATLPDPASFTQKFIDIGGLAGFTDNGHPETYFSNTLDDVALWSGILSNAKIAAITNLANSTLNYGALNANALFTAFDNTTGTTVGGKTWSYAASGVAGLDGAVNDLGGGNWSVNLGGGAGMVTVVPEPGTLALLAAGLLGLLCYAWRKRR